MTFKYTISNIILFVVVFLLQVFVFNNVNVYDVGFPMIYPMVILLIPVLQPAYIVLLAAFFIGLSVDFFTNTGGLHAAALTFMAFSRIYILNKMEPQANYSKDDRPGLMKFGPRWTIIYFLSLLLMHHFIYFLIEESSIRHMGEVLLKTICSSLLSFMIVGALNAFIFRD